MLRFRLHELVLAMVVCLVVVLAYDRELKAQGVLLTCPSGASYVPCPTVASGACLIPSGIVCAFNFFDTPICSCKTGDLPFGLGVSCFCV